MTKQPIYKVFEASNDRECLLQMAQEGFTPLSLQETVLVRKHDIVPFQWYDTATLYNPETGELFTEYNEPKIQEYLMDGSVLRRVGKKKLFEGPEERNMKCYLCDGDINDEEQIVNYARKPLCAGCALSIAREVIRRLT